MSTPQPNVDLGQEMGPLAPLAEGTTLGERYRLDRFLEFKNGANLYRATDQATNFTVIVKERPDRNHTGQLPPNLGIASSEGAEKAHDNPWQNEFLILRSVSYPTVVKALDVFKVPDRAYLVIEQLEGRDLAYLLRNGIEVSVQQSLDWMIQLCQSLGQLHKRQILHLDLQPRYVVVAPDGDRVRLTGFHRASTMPCLDRPSSTPGYSPPEQYRDLGLPIDERADIYSLGMIWHYLLTGSNPELFWEVPEQRFQIPDASVFRPAIHPQIERIVRRMVAPHVDDRYGTIAELKNELLSLVNNPVRRVGHFSDVGICRQGNEDSLAVFDLNFTTQSNQSGIGLYVVADGMGGVNAGEIASALAVDEVAAYVQNSLASLGDREVDPATEIRAALQQAIKNANSRIYETGRYNSELSGMGTTVTAALIFGQTVFVGHVGDSRAYLINKAGIEKISRDHSLVGRLLEIGQITPEEAAVHPQRNLIYRSLGTYSNVEVDIYQRNVKIGDWLLLCSDGLTGHVADDELQSVVLRAQDPHIAAQQLVNLANQRGGEDNITVVLVQLAEYV